MCNVLWLISSYELSFSLLNHTENLSVNVILLSDDTLHGNLNCFAVDTELCNVKTNKVIFSI